MTKIGIYLDYNASAPMEEAVANAVRDVALQGGNPSSVHRFGNVARRAIEDAREKVASFAAARPSEVVFTSGGTESNNLAIGGSGRETVFVSAVEHDSVLAPAADKSLRCEIIAVDTNGVVDTGALDQMLTAAKSPALVSVMFANNETGVIQPVKKIAEIAHSHGALFHCDAVQAAGRLSLDELSGADLISLSAHKLGGPMGVGALIVRHDSLKARIVGGGQERGRRAGTENGPGIAGFGVAAEIASTHEKATEINDLRDNLEARLTAIGGFIFGDGAVRIGNTSCVSMPRVAAETQVIAFDLDGIAISVGAACSSGKVGASHVLAAMGVAVDDAETAIRVSLGHQTTSAQIDQFIDSWTILRLRTGDAARSAA
jgi:cysteine desulfurase